MTKVAVVILNWNGERLLAEYLPVLLKYADGAEIWVADNASTDGSIQLLQREYPTVKLICLEQNYGFAGGYNKALKAVEAEYYVLLNSDVEVTGHWLAPLVAYMDTHRDVAACQPKLLSLRDRGAFEYAGASGGFVDKLGYPFCRGRIFNVVERDNGQYDDVSSIMWATGACLFIRSADFWAVNGFDERFFAHSEEIDLCWRLRNKGRGIVCVPQSFVYHLGGATLTKGNPRKTFLNFRNNLLMLYKNVPDVELATVMRWRWFLDYVAAWQMLLLQFDVANFKAVYQARKAFKRMHADFVVNRQTIQAGKMASDDKESKVSSVLWQYYIKGRKMFSQLHFTAR